MTRSTDAPDAGRHAGIDRPIRTVDYHTAGEPFRIVTGGVPELEGRSVLQRRRWALEHLDGIRRLLVNEPRGHADMYGAFVTPPDDAWADLGVVFFHNEGYSTACGHGTIALVTWVVDTGRVDITPGSRTVAVTVDVPSGRLACQARLDTDGRVEAVRFRNVPSFVVAREVTVRTSRGPVTLDVVHPAEPDLEGIYGVIFWERLGPNEQRNVTVFADGEIDRSPCGSGTSARLAVLHTRGELATGERFLHRSIVDSTFEAWIVGEGPTVGGHASVITEVEGSAYRTGESMFSLDPRDPLGTGFLLR